MFKMMEEAHYLKYREFENYNPTLEELNALY